MEERLAKGQQVFWTRILENVNTFDLYDLKVRTLADDYFVASDPKTKQAYLFQYADLDKIVFTDRLEANETLNMKRDKFRNTHKIEQIHYETENNNIEGSDD